jgi:Gnt-I system high-affinity gluconate transporter
MVLLITGGAGALKEVFVQSGVSQQLGTLLGGMPVNLLFLGWAITGVLRVCIGAATVAGLTAGGIMAPLLMAHPEVNPNLMVLAIGGGSLMFSHVNDPGFWLFKEYLGLSVKDTIRSWSLMETTASVCGLVGVLLLDWFSR